VIVEDAGHHANADLTGAMVRALDRFAAQR
jgi:hypothetical protein